MRCFRAPARKLAGMCARSKSVRLDHSKHLCVRARLLATTDGLRRVGLPGAVRELEARRAASGAVGAGDAGDERAQHFKKELEQLQAAALKIMIRVWRTDDEE